MHTWQDIAEELGISRQAAQQRFGPPIIDELQASSPRTAPLQAGASVSRR